MLREIGELAPLWLRMNDRGRQLLVTMAKDVLSHNEYKSEVIIEPETDDLDAAVELGNSWH